MSTNQYHGIFTYMCRARIVLTVTLSSLACSFAPSCFAQTTATHSIRQVPVGQEVTNKKQILQFIDAIQKDLIDWRDGIEFVGTFMQRDSMAASFEDAVEGVDVSSEEARQDESKIVGKGLFAKKGRAFRYRVDSNQGLFEQLEIRGSTVTGFFSTDLSAARGLEFKFSPLQQTNNGGQHGGTIYFGKFDYLPNEALTTEKFHYFPFDTLGGNFGYPFHRAPRPDVTEYTFENTKDGFQITIHSMRKDSHEQGYDSKITYAFVDTRRGPLLKRRVGQTGSGAHQCNYEYRMIDLVDCGDGHLFPRGMMITQKFEGPDKRVRAISWYTDDVGARAPTEDDFAVRIPSGTFWFGYDPNGGDKDWRSRNNVQTTLNVLRLDANRVRGTYAPARKPNER